MRSHATPPLAVPMPASPSIGRTALIGLIAFLTVVDLFGMQAILPALTVRYGVSPATMGSAVNASTIGMAVAGLAVALFGERVERRRAILIALALLAIPTSLLALAPGLAAFAALRVAQGLCMASAAAFTIAHLGERCAGDAGRLLAAYVAGNVASNLLGRLLAAALADHFGLPATFLGLAALNLAGALLVGIAFDAAPAVPRGAQGRAVALAAIRAHLEEPSLRASFAIGFCILFAFIGTFTYVNFVLVRPPISVTQMGLGAVYVVFAPSIATTLFAGVTAAQRGARPTLQAALGVAAAGLPLLLVPNLAAVLAGLVLVAIGTFFAQAVATAFVGRTAGAGRGSAGGVYIACYFAGGIAGSIVLGTVFDSFGWPACVTGIGAALALAAALAARLPGHPDGHDHDA